MLKISKTFYPHIVKKYDTVEQMITENGYDDFTSLNETALTNVGIDITDPTKFQKALTEDGYEGRVTIVYEDEATRTSVMNSLASSLESVKSPIFEEETENHLF